MTWQTNCVYLTTLMPPLLRVQTFMTAPPLYGSKMGLYDSSPKFSHPPTKVFMNTPLGLPERLKIVEAHPSLMKCSRGGAQPWDTWNSSTLLARSQKALQKEIPL